MAKHWQPVDRESILYRNEGAALTALAERRKSKSIEYQVQMFPGKADRFWIVGRRRTQGGD